jgi:hypothetical protein
LVAEEMIDDAIDGRLVSAQELYDGLNRDRRIPGRAQQASSRPHENETKSAVFRETTHVESRSDRHGIVQTN